MDCTHSQSKSSKYGSSILSNPLASIMNLSIQKGIYPSKLKHAKIVPLYKDGDELDPGNYRPISLLSDINRIFEKLVYNRINNFISKHKILCPSQYGFRKHCSTEHALLDIVGKIQKYMDENYFLVAFLLIYVKLLILLTTIFCSINYIIMEYVVS